MTRGYLRVRFLRDDDWIGELVADAASDGFSGRSSAWFHRQTIEEFAQALVRYPLANESPPTIAGGYGAPDTSDRLEQEHLGITADPLGTRGQIGVQVRLATPLEQGSRPESQCCCRVEIRTTWEPLSRFSRQLLAVLDGSADEALLNGDE
jgi:hypothetical protein